ncbi:hypothetical protein [Halomonas koreensis]|uniref:Uncharacterized protein n=1 Tax=Halomonas koreensis TaxID=245385 RepID=A0ABU1G2Z8_9GAMM|nr:hypothetical protein [Halomonas koreensis]MDR5867275.1 hypothetical protein [Halomonas koreensis]
MTADVLRFPHQARPRRSQQVTSWNADEDEALDALPLECQVIYLRVMRRHMDYATGIVGRVRRIDYRQILERLEYRPPAGSREEPVTYSRDQVKRLIQRLVTAGLLVRLHDTTRGVAPMEFYLPLADADGVPEAVAGQEGAENPQGGAENSPPRQNPHGAGAGTGQPATEGAEIPQGVRHGSATGGAPRQNPHGRASGEGQPARGAPREERHPSGTSGVEANASTSTNARETGSTDAGAQPRPPKERPDAAIQNRSASQWGTADDLALAEWMAARVDALPGGTERRSMAAWANEIRLMRERDGRELRHIRALFAWANRDEFWQVNIRSPRKLRAQWKPLAMRRNQERERAKAQEARHAQQPAGGQGAGRRRMSAQEARAQARAQQQGGSGNVYDGDCTPRDGE